MILAAADRGLLSTRMRTEKMTPFLVFRQMRALKIAVEVGLVVGTIAASNSAERL
jgi:hypothetical protein